MELTTGVYKISSLAEWFGITKNYFSKKKKEKLEELKYFCDYELIDNTKIKILTVKFPIYEKKASINYSIIEEAVPKKWGKGKNKLDCCSRVSGAIYAEREENNLTLSEKSTYIYTCKVKNSLYGKCGSQVAGKLGTSRYVWGKLAEDGSYDYLSPEEEEIKKELLKKHFKTSQEASLFVQDSINKGELNQEEAWEKYAELTNLEIAFQNFMTEFYEKTGIHLVKCTEIILEKNFE